MEFLIEIFKGLEAADAWSGAVAGLIAGAIGTMVFKPLLLKMYRVFRSALFYILSLMGRPIRLWVRKRQLRHLEWLRRIRTDGPAITREIVRSYAYLILFWISFLLWLFILGNKLVFPDAAKPSHIGLIFLSCPTYCFEICWLRRSSRVDAILRNRNKIKRWRSQH